MTEIPMQCDDSVREQVATASKTWQFAGGSVLPDEDPANVGRPRVHLLRHCVVESSAELIPIEEF